MKNKENKEIKINETHLIILRKNNCDEGVNIDYVPIISPLRDELDELYEKCDDKHSVKDSVDELLNYNVKFRDVLGANEFCWELHLPYQGMDDLGGVYFVYDKDLTKAEKEADIEEDKAYLKKQMQRRDLPYAIEKTYETLYTKDRILASSHRRRGWAEPRFNLTEDFSVQFLTNFGYGRVSYFYTKLMFNDIDIIPFSEWVIYSDGDLYEIIEYSRNHGLENRFWEEAMVYVRDAVNLYIEDEDEFISKYIIHECELMVKGLEYIINDESGYPYFAKYHRDFNKRYRFENKRMSIKYRGEKISGALTFIDGIIQYKKIASVESFIYKIEEFNRIIQPILIKELDLIACELEEPQKELSDIEPILVDARNEYMYLKALFARINKISESKGNLQEKSNKIELKDLFEKKYPDYHAIKNNYYRLSEKYNSIRSLIVELEKFRSDFSTFNNDIIKYFHDSITAK